MAEDTNTALFAALDQALGDKIIERCTAGEAMIVVAPADVGAVALVLRDDAALRFNQLMDVCGADYPERAERFEVVYQFLSLPLNRRLTVKVRVAEGQEVPSLVSVYRLAGWFERETYDMFGVVFAGHGDLRRILTDYDFEDFPLRKDFPMWGRTEVRYDAALRKIVYEPVDLTQQYRDYQNVSPWREMPVAREDKS